MIPLALWLVQLIGLTVLRFLLYARWAPWSFSSPTCLFRRRPYSASSIRGASLVPLPRDRAGTGLTFDGRRGGEDLVLAARDGGARCVAGRLFCSPLNRRRRDSGTPFFFSLPSAILVMAIGMGRRSGASHHGGPVPSSISAISFLVRLDSAVARSGRMVATALLGGVLVHRAGPLFWPGFIPS